MSFPRTMRDEAMAGECSWIHTCSRVARVGPFHYLTSFHDDSWMPISRPVFLSTLGDGWCVRLKSNTKNAVVVEEATAMKARVRCTEVSLTGGQ